MNVSLPRNILAAMRLEVKKGSNPFLSINKQINKETNSKSYS